MDRRGAQRPPDALVVDLLMATMDSVVAWVAVAGDRERGLAWRDAVTARMAAARRYVPYEDVVAAEAERLQVPRGAAAVDALVRAWTTMEPRADAATLRDLGIPVGFLTNCSERLARIAAARSRVPHEFVLSAEAIGSYKPDEAAYRAAVSRVGLPAERIGYVAGSAYDAAGAGAAGLRAVLLQRRPDDVAPAVIPVVASMSEAVDALGLPRRGASAGW